MQETLNRMRRRGTDDRGFTMIELLVVVVIIGILVAIAVPVYLNYRKGAANKAAQSDVRGAITAVEQYYTDNGNNYPADKAETTGSVSLPAIGTTGVAQTINLSPGVSMGLKNNSTSYVICAKSADGGGVYVYNSSAGGSVKKSGSTDVAACLTAGA